MKRNNNVTLHSGALWRISLFTFFMGGVFGASMYHFVLTFIATALK